MRGAEEWLRREYRKLPSWRKSQLALTLGVIHGEVGIPFLRCCCSLSLLVIPAEAGIQCLCPFARHSSGSWNPVFVVALDSALTASVRFSARIRASGSLSLACARESDQREHTPGAALPAAVRKVRPGFARWASCPFANSRASLRATLSGDSGLPSPRLTGPRIKSNSKSKSGFASAFRFSLLRAGRARSALPGAPWPCGGSGRKGPQGRREGSRRFRCCTGCAISGTRPLARTRRARCASGARRWGVFLCLLSLHEQRK